MQNILVVITARSGSKGVINKNVRLFRGHPLLAWSILTAKKAFPLATVFVSTDSEDYRQIALKYGASVPFLRPPELATDTSSSSDVLLHVLSSDFIKNKDHRTLVLLQPTAPLLLASSLQEAYLLLQNNSSHAESIVGVCESCHAHPDLSVSLNPQLHLQMYQNSGPLKFLRRQELNKAYYLGGSVFISTVDYFIHEKSFYHAKTMGYVMDALESIDIDTERDMQLAEILASTLFIDKFKDPNEA